jgi:phenylacetate-CoA ligase
MTPLPGEPLTEAERRPLIDADGRRLLASLLEHERAPKYNHTCGDRLSRSGLATVRAFDVDTATATPVRPGQAPPWLMPFVADVMTKVPRYRALGPVPARFEQIPTTGREDLVRAPWSFVPDDHALDDMVVFTTTGTTDGRVAYIPSTPEATASYAVLLRAALRTRGLTLDGGPGRVAVAQVCWQKRTYTYASISTFLGQAALLKLNLNPDDWRQPDDAVAFLDAIDAEVLTGDPVAFAKLAALPVTIHPKALLSTAMTLHDGLRATLEERFGCPVIDIYGMNESGPIAAALADGSGQALLQPRLHVEILGEGGEPLAEGVRGEITLTGGFNTALPLLRYRTGDHAALERRGDRPVLVGLAGRAPVPFVTADGRAVNTIDVTVALRRFSAGRYTVHQRVDRSLALGLDATGAPDEAAFVAALTDLFGPVAVAVHRIDDDPETVMYSTDQPDL